jgi:hypothetical protein
MRVFISYDRRDREAGLELAKRLREEGLDAWIDASELYPGDNWSLKTGEALQSSDAMVVLMSPEAAKSETVQREVQYALGSERFKDRLIPVILTPTPEIPWILRRLRPVQASLSELPQRIIQRLTNPPAPQGSHARAASSH